MAGPLGIASHAIQIGSSRATGPPALARSSARRTRYSSWEESPVWSSSCSLRSRAFFCPSPSPGPSTIAVVNRLALEARGADAAEDLALIWVRANARRRGEPVPADVAQDRVDALGARLTKTGTTAIIAVKDEMVVAGCFIEQLVDAEGHRVSGQAHLSGLAVEPSCWGEGLATLVIEHAEDVARLRGHRSIRLHVLEINGRARGLYENLGWVLVDTGHSHPAGPQAVYDKRLL